MLVCHCHSVTDRTIREAVRAGAGSTEAVASVCGAATGCGGCHELVEHIVADEERRICRTLTVQLRRPDAMSESQRPSAI